MTPSLIKQHETGGRLGWWLVARTTRRVIVSRYPRVVRTLGRVPCVTLAPGTPSSHLEPRTDHLPHFLVCFPNYTLPPVCPGPGCNCNSQPLVSDFLRSGSGGPVLRLSKLPGVTCVTVWRPGLMDETRWRLVCTDDMFDIWNLYIKVMINDRMIQYSKGSQPFPILFCSQNIKVITSEFCRICCSDYDSDCARWHGAWLSLMSTLCPLGSCIRPRLHWVTPGWIRV